MPVVSPRTSEDNSLQAWLSFHSPFALLAFPVLHSVPQTPEANQCNHRNRALSIRSNRNRSGSNPTSGKRSGGFSLGSLRGNIQPEISRKLYRLIKSENNLIQAHEAAGRERASIASQLSDWGEHTGDEGISDISDKVGVVLAEMGELEESYAHSLDDSRGILKAIRNTEKSVQPSRDGKNKIADEIAKIKMKEPESTKLVVLEQELVRAEAENLVAEAQLTNITREKLRQAYESEFSATIERAEKQILLAKHGRRLIHLLDEAPVAPGDTRPAYAHSAQARQILNDAEDDLRDWRPQPDEFGFDHPEGQSMLSQGNGGGELKGKGKQVERDESGVQDSQENSHVGDGDVRSEERVSESVNGGGEQGEAAEIRS